MRIFVLVLSLGCAASAPRPTTPSPAAVEQRAEIEELREQAAERDRELRELRSRLALAQAEAEELRETPEPRTETVRISHQESEDGLDFFDEDAGEGWDTPAETLPEAAPSGPRPVLRLYGTPTSALPNGLPSTALRSPELPSASLPPLPTAALPAAPVVAAPVAAAPIARPTWTAPQPRPTRAVDAAYRNALGSLRARRFDEALAGFDTFLRARPRHPLAANARYWRAEVLYIQRRYAEARTAFQQYLRTHGRSTRAPDALYKLALCFRRMGDEAGARRTLGRLRQEHPSSVAARMAQQEDAS
ncbi:MAG: tol-pal system protein YbgF [Myxococcota bacterium]